MLLYELLEAYGAENVVAISYKYPWLTQEKRNNEEKYRESFIVKMKLKGPQFGDFTTTVFDINQEGKILPPLSGRGLGQCLAWLTMIPLYTKDNEISYIYDAGIADDDLTLALNDYHQVFEGIVNVIGKNMILRNPYIKYRKYQILSKLIKYNIYENTWFCEIPPEIDKICGCCNPCNLHLYSLKWLSEFSSGEMVKMKAKEYYEHWRDNKGSIFDKDKKYELCVDKASSEVDCVDQTISV